MAAIFSSRLQRWALGILFAAALPFSSSAAVIKVGSIPGATSDAVQALIPEGKKQGLDIQLVEFTDWTLPNEAVNNGDIDVNFFQHQAFLNNAIKERGYDLELIGLGLLQTLACTRTSISLWTRFPRAQPCPCRMIRSIRAVACCCCKKRA